MRVGIVIPIHGTGGDTDPDWATISELARRAERVGFSSLYVNDHLSNRYRFWESVAVLGALAATTETIGLGHSSASSQIRSAELTAQAALTLAEVSSDRYTLGFASGRVPPRADRDGVSESERHTRFAESLGEIRRLFDESAASTPPIVVAASGPKSMRLAAELGDGWSGWADGESSPDRIGPMLASVDRACAQVGRDPETLTLSVDAFFDPLGAHSGRHPMPSGVDQVHEAIAGLAEIGIDEVRCYLYPFGPAKPSLGLEAVEAMSPVIEVFAGRPPTHAAESSRSADDR